MTIKLMDQARTGEQGENNQDHEEITDLLPTEAQVEDARGGINLLLPAIQKTR